MASGEGIKRLLPLETESQPQPHLGSKRMLPLETHQSQPQPHLGVVREDTGTEAAQLLRLPPAEGGAGLRFMGEGRGAPYTVADGIGPFPVPGAPSGGDTVLDIPEDMVVADLGGGGLDKGSAAACGVMSNPTFMRTAEVAEHETLLARLRGVGLYYTASRWRGPGRASLHRQ